MNKLSIVIYNNNSNDSEKCIQSINSQTLKPSETKLLDGESTHPIIEQLEGEYILFMPANYYFENDTVLEDVFMNVQSEDIVLCDTLCNKSEDMFSRDHVISAKIKNASNLIASPTFNFQSVFIKKECLLANYKAMLDVSNHHELNLWLTDIILNNKNTWVHLQIPVLHIDADKKDIEKAYAINLTDDYKAKLLQSVPLLFNDYVLLNQLLQKENNEEQKILQKFGRTVFFKIILKMRSLVFKTAYYDKKAARRTKTFNAQQAQKDAARKIEVEKAIEALPPNMLVCRNNASDVVVSLTSHQRRVLDSAPYAIYSMFTQTVLPNRVVLFINKEHWNNDNLPPIIKRLMQSGLEVEFCEDVRSHTKLIPALQKFPENPIITIDDDIYYNNKTIEELLTAYNKSDKKTVICHQGCYPQKRNGKFLPYSEWETSKYKGRDKTKTSLTVSAYGVSGVIYPPQVFPEEVFNKELFLRIAPHTDDIWFWIMEYRNGIQVQLIENSSQEKNTSVSYAEYVNPDGSLALYFENCFNGRNDKELKALLEYYGIE